MRVAEPCARTPASPSPFWEGALACHLESALRLGDERRVPPFAGAVSAPKGSETTHRAAYSWPRRRWPRSPPGAASVARGARGVARGRPSGAAVAAGRCLLVHGLLLRLCPMAPALWCTVVHCGAVVAAAPSPTFSV